MCPRQGECAFNRSMQSLRDQIIHNVQTESAPPCPRFVVKNGSKILGYASEGIPLPLSWYCNVMLRRWKKHDKNFAGFLCLKSVDQRVNNKIGQNLRKHPG